MYQLQEGISTAGSLATYAALLGDVFAKPKHFTVEYLHWLYKANPLGHFVGFDAFTPDGQLAAHYATIPVCYQRNGLAVKGLLSLNTATAAGHQGKGLFTQLAAKTYEAAAAAGYQFVIGVANGQSTPGFTRKLGFTLITPLEAWILTGKVVYPQEPFALSSLYTPEQLAWRFSHPSKPYFQHNKNVYAPTGVLGLSALLNAQPLENLFLPTRSPGLRLWLGHAPGRKLTGLAWQIPARLRPSPLHLIYLDLVGNSVPQASDLCMAAMDFDAY
jgi:GNAT superfamily N-acetyltransferase